MMKRLSIALAASAVFVTLGMAAPVFAAGQPANPATGVGPMVGWYWYNSGGGQQEEFFFGSSTVSMPFPSSSALVDQAWSGIDNPAPLEWYYNNVSKTWLGTSVFGAGVQYSATLISKMHAENFAPSMVGGVNPSGMTSSTVSAPPSASSGTTPKTSPSPTPTHSTAPVASTTPTVSHSTAPTTTTDITKTTTAPVTHSTAAASSSVTAVTPPTKAVTAPSSLSPKASPMAQAQASTALEPPGIKQETPPVVYRRTIAHDRQTLKQHHRHSAPPIPWIPVVAGLVGVGLVASGGWWAWRRFVR